MIAHIVFQPTDIAVNSLHLTDMPSHIRHLLRQHSAFLFPSVAALNALIQHDCGEDCPVRYHLIQSPYPHILRINIPDIGAEGSQPDIRKIKENQIAGQCQKGRCQHQRQLLYLHIFPFMDIYPVYHPDKRFHSKKSQNHINNFYRRKTYELPP